MIQVRGPDGAILQFPNGTPQATMHAAMSQHYAPFFAQRAAQQTIGSQPGLVRAMAHGATFGLSDMAAGAGAFLGTGARNLMASAGIGQAAPYSAAQAYQGQVNAEHAAEAQFAQKHPLLNLGATVASSLAAPGAEQAARFIGAAPGMMSAAGRSGAIGAATGAVSGAAGAAPNLPAMANGAAHGAAVGGGLGLVSIPASAGAQAIGRGLQGMAGNVGRMAGFVAPEQVATQRLAAALQKDLSSTGHSPIDLQASHANWAGNSTPTLADVGGENTRALMRTAASSGPARQTMVNYRDQVGADLQPNAIYLTSKLTPGEDRSGDQIAEALTQARAAAAAKQYQQPYNVQVDSAPLIPALEGDAGRRALAAALRESDAMRLTPQVQELAALKTAANPPPAPTSMMVNGVDTPLASMPPNLRSALTDASGALQGALPPTVSLGSLDRVKIALNAMGQDAQAAGRNGEAGGYFSRAQELDDSLASQSPDYAAARDNYAGASRQIDAVGTGGSILKALGNRPEDYGAALQNMSPGETWAAQNGARSALTDAIGAPMESAQGTLNRISTGTNTGRNLAATFGPDQADTYRAGLAAELERMSNANYMSPNTGSQTQTRGADSGAMGWLNPHHLATALLGKIANGPDLSDAERAAIVGQGLNSQGVPDPLLAALMKTSKPSAVTGGIGYLAGAVPPLLVGTTGF